VGNSSTVDSDRWAQRMAKAGVGLHLLETIAL